MQQLLFDLNVGTEPRQRHNTSHKGRTDCAGGGWMKGLCLAEMASENWGRGRHGGLWLVCVPADRSLPGCSLGTTDVWMKRAGTIRAGLSSVGLWIQKPPLNHMVPRTPATKLLQTDSISQTQKGSNTFLFLYFLPEMIGCTNEMMF